MKESRVKDEISFENNEVNVQSLPQIEQLKLVAISSKHRMANLGINILLTLLALIIALFVHFQNFMPISPNAVKTVPIICVILALILLGKTIFGFFADKRKFYALRNQDLSYISGLIFKKAVTQPILRIQHVELKRGPIDRKLGLAKIQVFSAGGATHTFEIPGLEVDTAESIRQFILDHKDVVHHG